MTKKRRAQSAEFKPPVVLEAFKGIKPVHQIASEQPDCDITASHQRGIVDGLVVEVLRGLVLRYGTSTSTSEPDHEAWSPGEGRVGLGL